MLTSAYLGCAYNLRYENKKKLLLRYWTKDCVSKIHTDIDLGLISSGAHNHEPDYAKNKLEIDPKKYVSLIIRKFRES
jgi:CRISPR/Cas system-associated protein Cas5 (RAMP superfamily)